jgi:acyl-CoA reductase-like NAD-dependent aldehyde dehydrogenase
LTRAAPLAALLAALFGCGPSPARKNDLARRTVHSWTATARRTRDALERGAVPQVYARQVVDAAIESRAKESKQPEWATLPPQERSELDWAIHQLALVVGEPVQGGVR